MKAQYAAKCQSIMNELYNYTLRKEFEFERQTARELFSISTGKINDDDPFFESRMACFQEFFLFDYRLSSLFSGSTIFETFIFNAAQVLELNELNKFEQIRCFDHSLFRVLKVKNDLLVVENILNKRIYNVNALPEFTYSGFDEKQIFEGRMITIEHESYFTGSFVLHNSQVKSAIEKHVKDFLAQKTHCKYKESINWKNELIIRQQLMSSLAEQKQKIEQSDRKRSIDFLNITKKIAEIPRQTISKNLLMSLGESENMSVYVPETPFYDPLPLLHMLSYCEVRSYRYKHIDPIKIYEKPQSKKDETNSHKIEDLVASSV